MNVDPQLNTHPRCELTIQRLRLEVKLGVPEEERATPQPIELTIELSYPEPPRGCETDHIGDTLDYDALCRVARDFCLSRQFRLVEHLGSSLHQALRLKIPRPTGLVLRVHKLHPPIHGLEGGVCFTFRDGEA